MASKHTVKPATTETVNGLQGDCHVGDGSSDTVSRDGKQARSKWREQYKVHPAADVFPMMSDDELQELGADIAANGLRERIKFTPDPGDEMLDGRNRMEAMERAGIKHDGVFELIESDPVAYIISTNIRRRHLTKQQQADLIVAAVKAGQKPTQVESVSKGGRGKINPVKAKAVAAGKNHGISKATVERALAKAEGKTPKPKPKPEPKAATSPKPKPEQHVGLDAARRCYLDRCADPAVDLDAEQKIILDAFREIAGKRAMARTKGQTAQIDSAQIDLKEVIAAQAPKDDDPGDIPPCLDRRRQAVLA